jgi:lysozyme family protein
MSEMRAAIISGLAFGLSAGIVSGITYASVATNAPAQSILSFAAIVLVVALIGAWIRLRAGALYPAVAFYLLLLGFSPY